MTMKWVDIDLPNLTGALGEALASEKDSWDDNVLHVSDLAAGLEGQQDRMCRRLLWLRLNGAKKKEPSLWQRMMWDHGKRIESRVNDLIKDYLEDWVILDQTPNERMVVLPEGITGTYDAMLKNTETGRKVILDNKTLRGRAFNFLDSAKLSHIMQVRGYLMGTDIQDGMLWYIDREGQNHPITFHVLRKDEEITAAIEVVTGIRDQEYPPLPMKPKFGLNYGKTKTSVTAGLPWQCDWCDYLNISCNGALPQEMRSTQGRVVGWLEVGGNDIRVVPKEEYSELEISDGILFGYILYSQEEQIIHEVLSKWYPKEEGSG